jgi:hypothetical protein
VKRARVSGNRARIAAAQRITCPRILQPRCGRAGDNPPGV